VVTTSTAESRETLVADGNARWVRPAGSGWPGVPWRRAGRCGGGRAAPGLGDDRGPV